MTRTSEQIAFEFLGSLSARDRRLVDAWRALGHDLTTALLESGVLRPSGHRRHPNDVALAAEIERVDALIHERRERSVPGLSRRRMETAEHEAAHAVVAGELGVDVARLWISDDGSSGSCIYERTTAENAVTIAVAGEVWLTEFRSLEYPGRGDVGCEVDRQIAVAHADGFGVRVAAQAARAVLRSRGSMVASLASRLARDGEIVLSGGDTHGSH
jgi:hypothetical protein